MTPIKKAPITLIKRSAPPEGKHLKVGALNLHYHDYLPREPADPVPLVFIHGSGPGASGYSNFKHNVPVFVEAGYRVILPDLPGFGYSDKPTDLDYTTDFFVEHLIGMLDILELEQCSFIGNSLGGAISIRAALDHPQRLDKLVLMAPGGLEELETYMAMPSMAKMIANFVGGNIDLAGLGAMLETLVFDPRHVTEALIAERFAILQEQPPEVMSRMRVPNMEAEMSNLAGPILAFWGVNDELVPASGGHKITRICRQARLVEVAECGHWVMVEHARMFNATCIDFLQHG